MEKARIGVISPGSELGSTVLEVSRELGLSVDIREGTPKEAVAVLREWETNGEIEIVVTRGSTASLLKRQSSLPIVGVEVGGLDIAEAVRQAKTLASRIILMDLERCPNRYNYQKIAGIAGVEFDIRLYRLGDDLLNLLEGLGSDPDCIVVATDPFVLEAAISQGIAGLLVHTGKERVQEALKKAADISNVRRRDVRLCQSFQAVLNNAYDGIMAVEKNEVTLFNHVAERITGLKAQDVLGKPVTEVCRSNAACRALYGDGKEVSGGLIYLGELPMVVNRLSGPVGLDKYAIFITFQAADKIRRMEAKLRQELHNQGLVAKFRFHDIVGHSAMLGETVREARKYARSEAAVLITGESGTGKELFAQSIHNESSRRDGPFVAINCAALPENLLESELFGYDEGAFTGAKKGGKHGLFSLAHGGTIFLDEVAELSFGLQARLLRVLQEKEVMPVGGQRIITVDVRVISATNRNLPRALDEGRFRRDLFFRINVLHLQIPSLRERLEDVPELFAYFLERLAGSGGVERFNLTTDLGEELKRHLWPGNARELQGFAERYVALGEDDTHTHVTFFNLLEKLLRSGASRLESAPLDGKLAIELGPMLDMEKQILLQASRLIKGNRLEMAKVLGISRTTLWKKLKDLEIN